MFGSTQAFLGILTAGLWLGASAIAYGEDWPAFRGGAGDGVSHDSGFPIEWSTSKNVKWRIAMPAPGNSSPIVVGKRVFYTCATPDGKERTLFCVDRSDGQLLWKESVTLETVELTHKTNPYCPSTPVSDGDAIYVWHGSAGMHAYSLDGKLRWSRDLGVFKHIWGLGASPIVVGELVIQLAGPGERTFVAAMDRRSGNIVWQTPDEPGGSESSKGRYVGTWATPRLASFSGQSQLVCCYHSRVVGLDPLDGRERWSIDGLSNDRSDLCYAMPMISDRNIVIMGGFGGPEFGFQVAEDGTVTEKDRRWRNEKLDGKGFHPQRIGTGVTLGRHLWMANADEPGSIECLDMTTGIRTWSEKRTADGPHWGSMVMAEGRLYVPGQKRGHASD